MLAVATCLKNEWERQYFVSVSQTVYRLECLPCNLRDVGSNPVDGFKLKNVHTILPK